MYRQVHSSIWVEQWFEAYSPQAKVVFLYLLTGPDTDAAGFTSQTLARLSFNTGIPRDQLPEILTEVAPKVRSWPEHNTYWVARFARWQGKGAKWDIAVSKALAERPAWALQAFKAEYPNWHIYDTPSIGYPDNAIPHAYPINTPSIGHRTAAATATAEETVTPLPPTKESRKKEKVKLVDDAFRQAMRERFSSTLTDIDERIDEALAHKAAAKYKDQQKYVLGWLRRDAERTAQNVPSFRPNAVRAYLSPAHNPPSVHSIAAARAAGAPLPPDMP